MPLPFLARALGAAAILALTLGACGYAPASPYAAVACASVPGGQHGAGDRADYADCIAAHDWYGAPTGP